MVGLWSIGTMVSEAGGRKTLDSDDPVLRVKRGGSVRLNGFEAFRKWISRSVMPPPVARQGMRSMSREGGLVATG